MKIKSVIFGFVTALVLVILFNNKEETTFWLFKEIRTSKLFILAAFFLLGLITGGFVFRRKRKHPKEYSISGAETDYADDIDAQTNSSYSQLSAEDRKFLGRED